MRLLLAVLEVFEAVAGGVPLSALPPKSFAISLYEGWLMAGRGQDWRDFLPDIEEALRWLDASGALSVPGELGRHPGTAQLQDYLRHLSGKWASVWLDAVARSAAGGDGSLAAEARTCSALACVREGNVAGARERFADARGLARESGRSDLEAAALRDQAAFAFWTGSADETSGLAQEVLRLSPTGRTRGDLITLTALAMGSLGEAVEGPRLEELLALAKGSESSISPALRLLVGSTALGRLPEGRDLERIQSDLETAFEPAAGAAEDPGVHAWALALRAELSTRQGDWKAARESTESALRLAREGYDWEAEAEALRVSGQIQEAIGDVEAAESSYRRLLELREQLYSTDHEGVAWAARDLARVLMTMGRYPEAEAFLSRASGIFRRGRPRTDRALSATLYEWDRLLLVLGRPSEAETLLREALAASLSSLGSAHLYSLRILGMLAAAAQDLGRSEEAEDLLRSALAIQERSGTLDAPAGRYVLGQNLSLLARMLAARGQVGEALALLQNRQLPLFEELGDPRARAVTLGQIAELLGLEQRYEEALPLLRKRVDFFDQAGDVRGRATALGEIAALFAVQKRYAEALAALREQVSILDKLGDRQAAEDARKTLRAYEAEAAGRGAGG